MHKLKSASIGIKMVATGHVEDITAMPEINRVGAPIVIAARPTRDSGGKMMEKMVKGRRIRLIQGDLTELAVDAIVNAANASLILGGGVAGAIRVKGGSSIQAECDRIGGTTVGEAVVTGAGKLKANHVIHAVGPRYGEGDEDEKLRLATLNSLKRANERGLLTIAFPAISTGIFGFPKDRCAKIMIDTVEKYLESEESSLSEVVFCLWSKEDLAIFQKTLESPSL